MTTDYEKQAKDLHDAISAHDIEKVFTFYTDDILFEQVWEGGVVTHGKEEMRSLFKTMYTAVCDPSRI